MTQVKLKSMMMRRGVIRGKRTWAARSLATPCRIEPARLLERLGAQELVDPGRAVLVKKRVGPAGAEHRLGPIGDPGRQRSRGHLAQQPFVGQPAQLVLRRDRGAERDHVVVQERIPRLDRRVHRHPVALAQEQETGQHDLVADVERLVQRMPARKAVVGEVQVVVGGITGQAVPQRRPSKGATEPGP